MLRWSDLGAGLRASPRVALRWELWRQVLARLLFSRVFLGYASAGVVLYLAGRGVFTSMAGGAGGSGGSLLLMAVLVAGPALLLLAGVLLLPYAWWAFNPAAAQVVTDYLRVKPPRVEQEPPFAQYLTWTFPLAGLMALLMAGYLIPQVNTGGLSQPYTYAGLVLVLLSVMKLFTRSALAAHYPPDDIERFLAATFWQRLLLWLPIALAIGWAADWLVQGIVTLLGVNSVVQAGMEGWLLVLGLNFMVSGMLAIAFTGALLLACGRLPGAMGDTATAIDTRLGRADTETRPMSRSDLERMRTIFASAPRRIPKRAVMPRWVRRTLVAGATLATLAGAALLARLPLTDWYFGNDPLYARAADLIHDQQPADQRRSGPVLQPGALDQRLRAGYIMYGCSGDLERAGWLLRLGVPEEADHNRMLACAACTGAKPAVVWLLQAQPELRVGYADVAFDARGQQRKSALACVARNNDVALARTLLARGAHPRGSAGRSATEVAAAQQHWQMLRLLLQRDRLSAPAATFAALDAAHARDPALPGQLVPRMVESGLQLHAVDRNGRNLFHWAAQRHDLALARALLERADLSKPEVNLLRADQQGLLPWMYVQRAADAAGEPLSADATELLRLLQVPDDR